MSEALNPAGPSGRTGLRVGPDLRHKRRPGEAVIKALLLASAILSVAITVGIIITLIRPVIDFFQEIPFGDFFATEGTYAVLPLIVGTLLVTVIALLVAVPLGLGAAMYLSEYASPRARRWLKPTVELLAGVPSVV
jgi:ABC-type phosphate transport system permease subunit